MQKIQRNSGFGLLGLITILAIVALLGFGGWYVWLVRTNTQTNKSQISQGNTKIASQNVFKIAELGVEFDVKGGITPVYYEDVTQDPNFTNDKRVELTTQQLIDEGRREGKAGNTQCGLDRTDTSDYFDITDMYIYNSVSDTINDGIGLRLTSSDITPANGYFNINGKIFAVRQIPLSASYCTNTPSGNQLEKQQFELLRESLMTLRAIQ